MEKGDLVRIANQSGWSTVLSWTRVLPIGTILRVANPNMYGDVELEPLVPESAKDWPNGSGTVTLPRRNIEAL